MITLQRLLNSLIVLASLSSAVVFADEKLCNNEFEVVERNKGSGYSFQKRTLENFYCNNSFESPHFKIVYSTNKEAIKFNDENKAIIKKAANVYYHLTIARKFWIDIIKSDYVKNLPQIVIRIDITNSFSSVRHFKNAEQEKNNNNAWSVPEGVSPVGDEQWGKEIWFSPVKKIETVTMIKKSTGQNPIHESLVLVEEPIIEFMQNALIYQGLSLVAAPRIPDSDFLVTALAQLGTIAITAGLTEGSKHIDKWFVNKYYFVDTALVPDIIYHEFSHIALSDTMKTVHSVPVIEGLADYFATRIADRRKMYQELKNISSNRAKDRENKKMYHPYLEGDWNATSDFTLSLLWRAKEDFDDMNKKRFERGLDKVVDFDELLYQAHYDLNEFSNISKDLTGSLKRSCHAICKGPRIGVDILHNAFEKKGMN